MRPCSRDGKGRRPYKSPSHTFPSPLLLLPRSHLLFNRPAHAKHRAGQPGLPAAWRLVAALLLVDVFSRLHRLTSDRLRDAATTAAATAAAAAAAAAAATTASSASGAEQSSEADAALEDDADCAPEDSSPSFDVVIDDTCLGPGLLGYEIDLLNQHSSYAQLVAEREARAERLRAAAVAHAAAVERAAAAKKLVDAAAGLDLLPGSGAAGRGAGASSSSSEAASMSPSPSASSSSSSSTPAEFFAAAAARLAATFPAPNATAAALVSGGSAAAATAGNDSGAAAAAAAGAGTEQAASAYAYLQAAREWVDSTAAEWETAQAAQRAQQAQRLPPEALSRAAAAAGDAAAGQNATLQSFEVLPGGGASQLPDSAVQAAAGSPSGATAAATASATSPSSSHASSSSSSSAATTSSSSSSAAQAASSPTAPRRCGPSRRGRALPNATDAAASSNALVRPVRRVACGICGDTGPELLPPVDPTASHHDGLSTFSSSAAVFGSGGALSLGSHAVSELIWSLPDLSDQALTMTALSGLELLSFLLGALLALRFAGTLSRSRCRIDPATGAPRVPAPRSRRSLAQGEAHATAAAAGAAAAPYHSSPGGSAGSALPPMPPGPTAGSGGGTGAGIAMRRFAPSSSAAGNGSLPVPHLPPLPQSHEGENDDADALLTDRSALSAASSFGAEGTEERGSTGSVGSSTGPPLEARLSDALSGGDLSGSGSEPRRSFSSTDAPFGGGIPLSRESSRGSDVSGEGGQEPGSSLGVVGGRASGSSEDGSDTAGSPTSGLGGAGEGRGGGGRGGVDGVLGDSLSPSPASSSAPPSPPRSGGSRDRGATVRLVPFDAGGAGSAGRPAAAAAPSAASASASAAAALAPVARRAEASIPSVHTTAQSGSAAAPAPRSASSGPGPRGAPAAPPPPKGALGSWRALFQPARDVIDPSPPTVSEMQTTALALLVSSFGRALVALSAIWAYPPSFSRAAAAFALSSNVAALQAVCDCSPGEAAVIVAVGYAALLGTRTALWAAGYTDSVTLL